MAKMIDKLPEYEGEKKVWEYFSKNLPQQYVVYNNRSIKGWEYDFCVMAENVGLFIIEVKGWLPQNIFNVVSEDAIILSGEEQPQASPRKQARGYRFNMINLLKQELGMNPLVMDLVCYPMISKNEYLEKRLDVVSDETETIFKEDLEDPALLFQKLMGRYNINKSTPHDILDAKRFALIRHHFEPNFDLKERGYSSIHSIRGVLRPAFQTAVDDDLLLRNPFEFQLATVVVNDSVTKEAVTQEQERKFLKFIKEDSHYNKYYDGMFLLFKTGLRVSEFCGLTIHDIDFENNMLHITHQLQRKRDMQYSIEETKTTSGTRDIPMTEEVRECLERIVANRKHPKVEPIIDGYTGFLFYDKNNRPMVALHWEKYFHYAIGRYNRTYRLQLPKITPHICRHTYCSNMARAGMNPKTLQYLMGHSDIGVTMNTYTHLGATDARAELERLHLAGTSDRHKSRKIVGLN